MTSDGIRKLVSDELTCIRRFGTRVALQYLSSKLDWKIRSGSRTYEFELYPGRPPVTLRGGIGDFLTFRQIMVEEQYAPLASLKLDYILDLGANAGLASIWFLHRFPEAAVVAVEPNPDNYHIISMNLAPSDKRVRIVKGAVWHRPADLTLVRRNNEADAQVREIEPGDKAQDRIMAWDIPGLMEIGDFPIVDLLKIDIEGAELELFRNGPERWLPLIRNICIELHGAECKAAFFKALEGYEYEQATSGELTICTNLRPLALQDGAESDRSYWAARIFPPGRS